jgi:DNA-binding transcriptional LysR family regulator
MELRQLKYFVAVAEERHFRRAAKRLHVAQPSISDTVRRLEIELGVQLLLRQSTGVQLTPAGAALLDDARRILGQVEVAATSAQAARDSAGRHLRVGCSPVGLHHAVPGALARVRRAARGVDVQITTGDARTLLETVREGAIDVALVCVPAATAGLRLLTLEATPAVAVTTPGRRRSEASTTLAHVAACANVLLPVRRRDPAFYDGVIAGFHAAGHAPSVRESTATSAERLMLEVAAGAGPAILPGPVAERVHMSEAVVRPIVGATIVNTVAAVYRDEVPSTVLQRFLDQLAQSAAGLVPVTQLIPAAVSRAASA